MLSEHRHLRIVSTAVEMSPIVRCHRYIPESLSKSQWEGALRRFWCFFLEAMSTNFSMVYRDRSKRC